MRLNRGIFAARVRVGLRFHPNAAKNDLEAYKIMTLISKTNH